MFVVGTLVGWGGGNNNSRVTKVGVSSTMNGLVVIAVVVVAVDDV